MNQIANEHDVRLAGTAAFNAFSDAVSSSRKQMQASAISQHYVINGSRPNTVQTGAEHEYGKYTYSIKAEHNINKIIAVIDRYIPSPHSGIGFNPQKIFIYQTYDNTNNKPLYGIIDYSRISQNHTKFGFEFKPTKEAQNLTVGASVPKDTILWDSPAKDELGNYNFGRNLNTVYSSLDGTIEDSILIAKDVVPYFKTKVYVTRQIELGEKEFPLNLYGDDENYKVMPNIGEYCNPTGEAYKGIVLGKREYRPELLPVTFTKTATRRFDPITDIALDGNGSGARVVDIIVYRQGKSGSALADKVMHQLNIYASAYEDFCSKIVAAYKNILRETNNNADFTDEFDQLIRHCLAITNERIPDERIGNIQIQKVGNFNRKLDDIVVIVTTEYEKEVGPGFKLTDMCGGKGVVAKVLPPEEMPYDPVTGIRADIVISPETTVNRMNFGRIYEQTTKAALVTLERFINSETGLNKSTPNLKEQVYKLNKNVLHNCFNRIEIFLEITVEKQYIAYKNMSFQEKALDLYHIIKDRFYLYKPTDNPNRYMDVFESLTKEGFLLPPNKLRYYNPYTKREEETTLAHRIGELYYISLEKIGDDAASVSTAATQPNGIIAPLTSKDKQTQQTRKQATRFPAESENRYIVAGGPTGLAAELHDRSNNPDTVEEILYNIYNNNTPTNIEAVVDRNKIPLGGGRPLQIMKHIMQCSGYAFAYKEFDPSLQTLSQHDPITGLPMMDFEDEEDEESPKPKLSVSDDEEDDEPLEVGGEDSDEESDDSIGVSDSED